MILYIQQVYVFQVSTILYTVHGELVHTECVTTLHSLEFYNTEAEKGTLRKWGKKVNGETYSIEHMIIMPIDSSLFFVTIIRHREPLREMSDKMKIEK